MIERSDDCRRFEAQLDALLEGALHPGEHAAWLAHRDACPSCREAWRAAREANRALLAWKAPDPPPGLAPRILRLLRVELAPEDVSCLDLAAELDVLLAGDLPHRRTVALERHAAACAPCSHHLRVALRVDDLLRGWTVPEPRAGLAERILARAAAPPAPIPPAERLPAGLRSPESPAPRVAPLPRRRRGVPAITAAAAALLLAAITPFLLRDAAPPVRPVHPVPAGSFQEALRQIDAERELRMQQVALEQFPAAIATFDHQPLVADRAARPAGTLFHLAMREAAARNAVQRRAPAPGSGR